MNKRRGYQFRVLTPIRLALVAIVVISVVLIVASYEYGESDRDEWISSILLDVGFIMFGLAIAYVIGERLVNVADDHRWQEVDAAVCNRSFRAALTTLSAFSAAPSIRAALEADHAGPLPTTQSLLVDYPSAVTWSEQTLLPAIRRFTGPLPEDAPTDRLDPLTRQDWVAIRSGTTTAWNLTTATVSLALPRDIPSLLSDLLDLETALNSLSAALSRGIDFADAEDDLEHVREMVNAVAEAAVAVMRTVIDQED